MKRAELQASLKQWYSLNKRDLPWRQTADPYSIWISEIMLQQTQVNTVIPYYLKFLHRYPDIITLAKADLNEVLKTWEGLGYYARARNLHTAAKMIIDELGGSIPNDLKGLLKLPGIGEYTAAAIASIAFGVTSAVLDGNAIRVYCRWIGFEGDPRSPEGQKILKDTAHRLLESNNPGDWNQAIMELGAVICTPVNPVCKICPVLRHCRAYARKITDSVPRRKLRGAVPHFDVTAGLILGHDGRLLITKRKPKGLLGGLWEFPGGKLEPGETLKECLKRELREELAIEVEVKDRVFQVKHAYTHFRITLHVYKVRYISGEPQAIGCEQWKWVTLNQLEEFPFPRADRTVIESLLKDGIP